MSHVSLPFSFATYADDFERHIEQSIRGYGNLRTDCLTFSQYFVEDDTLVLDIGCSTGRFLRQVRDTNQQRVPSARYIGIDIERAFRKQWTRNSANNLKFVVADARRYDGYRDLSFVTSLFAMQFMPERCRTDLLQRVFDRMIAGGALVIAEKVHANSAKIQDMLTFMYYDFKRESFSENAILAKERALRDKMKLWSEEQIVRTLEAVGFRPSHIQVFWRNHLFLGILAIKASSCSATARPERDDDVVRDVAL